MSPRYRRKDAQKGEERKWTVNLVFEMLDNPPLRLDHLDLRINSVFQIFVASSQREPSHVRAKFCTKINK